jgi:hypothetical protein
MDAPKPITRQSDATMNKNENMKSKYIALLIASTLGAACAKDIPARCTNSCHWKDIC